MKGREANRQEVCHQDLVHGTTQAALEPGCVMWVGTRQENRLPSPKNSSKRNLLFSWSQPLANFRASQLAVVSGTASRSRLASCSPLGSFGLQVINLVEYAPQGTNLAQPETLLFPHQGAEVNPTRTDGSYPERRGDRNHSFPQECTARPYIARGRGDGDHSFHSR